MSVTKSIECFTEEDVDAALEICREGNNYTWYASVEDLGFSLGIAVVGYTGGEQWKNALGIQHDRLMSEHSVALRASIQEAKVELLRSLEAAAAVPQPPT